MSDFTPALIDGQDLVTGDSILVHSPYSGDLVGEVTACSAEHLDQAIAVAGRRHAEGALPAFERAEILDRIAAAMLEQSEEFAQSISAESAKPIATARVEAVRAVDTIRFSAAAARTFTGEMVAMDASAAGVGKLGYVKRVPIGVVAGISPFNFPLNLVCHKIAPALAAGVPIVLKPASATPLTALKIARLFEACGLPPGWLNVVPCAGSVANHMVEHEGVAMITFTGSPEVGWGIRARAPKKRVGLELGNNAPVIVEPDADLEVAASKIVAGGFAFSGQTCISVQRVYVHGQVHDELLGMLEQKVAALQVGDPADPTTQVSALIQQSETERVAGWIDEAQGDGARVVVGGGRRERSILEPTLLDRVTPGMRISNTEVFGPVIGVAAYDTFDQAVDLVNDSRYGLQAGVFTADITTALQAADRIDFGGVLINEVPAFRTDQQPYGGMRDSGNTREGPAYAIEEMTERKLIIIQG